MRNSNQNKAEDTWLDILVDFWTYVIRKKLRRMVSKGLGFPYVDFGSVKFNWRDDPAHCAPEMYWNDEFIEHLQKYGYDGEDEFEIVNSWLLELYQNSLYEDRMQNTSIQEAPMEPGMGREMFPYEGFEEFHDMEKRASQFEDEWSARRAPRPKSHDMGDEKWLEKLSALDPDVVDSYMTGQGSSAVVTDVTPPNGKKPVIPTRK